ncbi:MAG: hypothetical protein ACRC30_03330 [Clostridium sp.]
MKKGFTIIEMMVVCSILIIGIVTIDIGGRYIEDYKIKVTEEGFLNEMYSLINYGRERCVLLDKTGKIEDFKEEEGERKISFEIYEDKKGKKILKVPKEIKYEHQLDLTINNRGNLKSTALTWRGKKSGNIYKLSIGVGNNIIRIYINNEEKR